MPALVRKLIILGAIFGANLVGAARPNTPDAATAPESYSGRVPCAISDD
jgi:hypothetical protein